MGISKGNSKADCYFFFLEKVITMFNVSELRSQVKVISFVLLELKDFGLNLGDEEILLVRFNLRRREVLKDETRFKEAGLLCCRRT